MTKNEAMELINNNLEGLTKIPTGEGELKLVKGDIEVPVRYNEEAGTFDFVMLNGGHKSCKSFEDFKVVITTYFFINTEFVPNAKNVVAIFENCSGVGVKTAYNSFKGSSTNGWTAVFNVLDDDTKEVQVKLTDDGYHAGYLDKSAGKVIHDRLYVVDEAGNVSLKKSYNNFFAMLCDYYGDSEDFDIDRDDERLYTIKHEGNTLRIEVVIENNSYKFICNDTSEYTPKNPFDLTELFNYFFGGNTETTQEPEPSPMMSVGYQEDTFKEVASEEATSEEVNSAAEDEATEAESESSETEDDGLDAEDIIIDADNNGVGVEDTTTEAEDEGTEAEDIDIEIKDDLPTPDEIEEPTEEVAETIETEESSEEDILPTPDSLIENDEEIESWDDDDSEEPYDENDDSEEAWKEHEDAEEEAEEDAWDEDDSDLDTVDISDTTEEVEKPAEESTEEAWSEATETTKEVENAYDTPAEETEEASEEPEETTEEEVPAPDVIEEDTVENDNVVTEESSALAEEEVNMDFSLKLVKDDGNTVAVLVCYDDRLLKCGIEEFKATGFPIDAISEETQKVVHRGVALTEEEVSRRCFAKDITSDAEAIKSVVNDFFS